jgi:hypothetical protein
MEVGAACSFEILVKFNQTSECRMKTLPLQLQTSQIPVTGNLRLLKMYKDWCRNEFGIHFS